MTASTQDGPPSSRPDAFNRRRVLGSAIWSTAQQMVTMAATAVVGIVLARTLTVAEFGVYSYALSLAAIGISLMAGGLSGLAIKALIDDPGREAETMSGLIVIRECFAALAFVLLALVSLTSGSGDAETASLLALLVLFSRAWDATELWYQSKLMSRRSAGVRVVVVLLMLAVRLAAAALGAGLWTFLVLYAIEAALVSGSLVVRYRRESSSSGFARPDLRVARSLLGRSWLLLLSSAAQQINLKADQVILQALAGSASVGLYAAAARLSEIAYFLPGVFMTATFPALLAVRKDHGPGSDRYREMLQRSYDQACWVGIGIAATVFFLGPLVLTLLYGERYDAARTVLQIHVLALPFVFMAAVFSKWILAENILVASLIRHASGAALNVALNFVLIPPLGIRGSAIATVASYCVASYLACFIGKTTRVAGVQMTLALLWPARLAIGLVRR